VLDLGKVINYEGKENVVMLKKEPKILSDYSTVAKVFLSFEEMTHKKLQKLCYFAYAYVLAGSNGEMKLFANKFKAWIHGPVCPALHSEYSQYGVNDIIPKVCEHGCVSEETFNYLEKIFDIFGKYSADQLEEMTHNEKPWLNAREGIGKYQFSNKIINDEDIIEYY